MTRHSVPRSRCVRINATRRSIDKGDATKTNVKAHESIHQN